MASLNWLKLTRQKALSLKKHNGQQERLEYNHSNPDIDKSKTDQNYCIGCNDYDDAVDAMVKRVEEVDKLYPQQTKKKNGKPAGERKDRKIAISIEAKCPQEIFDRGQSTEFFEKTHQLLSNFFGQENNLGSCIHLDEMHPYIDEDGKEKMSLAHMTTLIAAYAEWKQDGKSRKGISASKLMNPSNLSKLNKAMCDMVRKEFGVEYNTGEKAKHKTVEQLKAESEIAGLKKEIAELTEDRDIVKEAGRIALAEQEDKIAKAANRGLQQLKQIAEQIEDKQSKLQDLNEQILGAVKAPPRPIPPTPPLPVPTPPMKFQAFSKAEEKEYNESRKVYERAVKQYEKDLKKYHSDYAEYEVQAAKWDNQFGLVDVTKKATAKAAEKEHEAAIAKRQAQQAQQQAQAELERGRAADEKRKRALDKREQDMDIEVARQVKEKLAQTDKYQLLMQTSAEWDKRKTTLHKGTDKQNEKTFEQKVSQKKGEFER